MTGTASVESDALLAAIAEGIDVVDLAQPLFNGMPCSPNHPGFKMALLRRHGDSTRPDGTSAANEIIVTGGHVGTHIDAFAHASHEGRLHGGWDSLQAQSGGRFAVHGVETIVPMVCRGVLLDVAAAHDTDCLPGGYGITGDDLDRAARQAGTEPGPGGVCLINTGWSRWWPDPDRYLGLETGVPGVTPSAAEWLTGHGIVAAGTDTTAFEQIHPGAGHAVLPVHRMLLVDVGVHIVENLRLTDLVDLGTAVFVFVLAPLKILGATGSPVRPLALVGGNQ